MYSYWCSFIVPTEKDIKSLNEEWKSRKKIPFKWFILNEWWKCVDTFTQYVDSRPWKNGNKILMETNKFRNFYMEFFFLIFSFLLCLFVGEGRTTDILFDFWYYFGWGSSEFVYLNFYCLKVVHYWKSHSNKRNEHRCLQSL